MGVTGEFTKSLQFTDFSNTPESTYTGLQVIKNVPVTLLYKVLPGNRVAFGAGANTFGGVRTALNMQICPKAKSINGTTTVGDPVIVKCNYRLFYTDPNKVKTLIIQDSYTEYVKNEVTQPNQFNYLALSDTEVGAFSFLGIQIIPLDTPTPASGATQVVFCDATEISIPVTVTTYSSAAGM